MKIFLKIELQLKFVGKADNWISTGNLIELDVNSNVTIHSKLNRITKTFRFLPPAAPPADAVYTGAYLCGARIGETPARPEWGRQYAARHPRTRSRPPPPPLRGEAPKIPGNMKTSSFSLRVMRRVRCLLGVGAASGEAEGARRGVRAEAGVSFGDWSRELETGGKGKFWLVWWRVSDGRCFVDE